MVVGISRLSELVPLIGTGRSPQTWLKLISSTAVAHADLARDAHNTHELCVMTENMMIEGHARTSNDVEHKRTPNTEQHNS